MFECLESFNDFIELINKFENLSKSIFILDTLFESHRCGFVSIISSKIPTSLLIFPTFLYKLLYISIGYY